MSEATTTTRFSEWDKDTEATVKAFADAREGKVRYDDVSDLIAELPEGVKPRQVVAKLVSMERQGVLEYVRKERTKKPRGDDGKPVTKASMTTAIAEALGIPVDSLDGLSKAPAAALSAILSALPSDDESDTE